VFAIAGDELMEDCRLVDESCSTGDAVFTRGFRLPAKYIVHAVSPRWSDKYRTAAESTLHSCYRKTLQLIYDNKWRSVALAPLYSPSKGFPRVDAAHIACRTLRRVMEHSCFDGLEQIILCCHDSEDFNTYKAILPYYFPRNATEEALSALHISRERAGNEWGDIVIVDRAIRISDGFTSLFGHHSNYNNSNSHDEKSFGSSQQDNGSSAGNSPVTSSSGNSVETMRGNHDKERLNTLHARGINATTANYDLYYDFLSKSYSEDYRDLEALNILQTVPFTATGKGRSKIVGTASSYLPFIYLFCVSCFLSFHFHIWMDHIRSNH
jgi:O-acetyl-ADP-ribose deacetylase (regulator of RNase III)